MSAEMSEIPEITIKPTDDSNNAPTEQSLTDATQVANEGTEERITLIDFLRATEPPENLNNTFQP